jgi:hypothetical protein
MARLTSIVHVRDEKGESFAFGPDDEVPAWAESLITNPKAWSEAPSAKHFAEPEPTPVKAPVKRASARRKAVPDAAVHDD